YAATMAVDSGQAWVMQMVAFRAAPSDAQPPTAPGNLSASATSSAAVSLSWTAATDNIAVASYFIERCAGGGCSNFAQIGTAPVPATSSANSGLPPNTSYTYRVRATDGAGNSGPSPTLAPPSPLPDSQAPTAPATLGATALGSTRIDLSWTAATDNVAVSGYL